MSHLRQLLLAGLLLCSPVSAYAEGDLSPKLDQCKADIYNRKAFKHWTDADGNGLNARWDAINRQRLNATQIHDPYTGDILTVGEDKIDVDHIVPLKAAFNRGANCWTAKRREDFANDPENLIATRAGSNRQKGASTIFNWIPARLNYCSEYMNKVLYIHDKYDLDLPDQDRKAFLFLYDKCAGWTKGINLTQVRHWFAEQKGWKY